MAQSIDDTISVLDKDGKVKVYVTLDATRAREVATNLGISDTPSSEANLEASYGFGDFTLAQTMLGQYDSYRSPRLTIPSDYYTQVRWAEEYYEQEPLVNALVNRDIDTAIRPVEFQLPEEQLDTAMDVLEEWREEVNRDIGIHGGLDTYNSSLGLDISLTSFTFTLANWGYLGVNGKAVKVPRVLVNLDPASIVPDINPLTGAKEYYLRLSPEQAEAIKAGKADGMKEIIPNARILDDIDFIVNRLKGLGVDFDPGFLSQGPYVKLPTENAYIITHRSRSKDRWPLPSLVPIFSAIAMKRKLQLADFAVADGMINMIILFTFPEGTKPSEGKALVSKLVTGGRVQAHSVPYGVTVELITPPHEMLNSSQKFWVPIAEILSRFGFILNSMARGQGDLDVGPQNVSENRARLDVFRRAVVGHNNFWVKQIARENGWNFKAQAAIATKDLDREAGFRTFGLNLWDRGQMSTETLLDMGGTTVEREVARRRREIADGIEETLQIRPSFAQTVVREPTDKEQEEAEGGGYVKTDDDGTDS